MNSCTQMSKFHYGCEGLARLDFLVVEKGVRKGQVQIWKENYIVCPKIGKFHYGCERFARFDFLVVEKGGAKRLCLDLE